MGFWGLGWIPTPLSPKLHPRGRKLNTEPSSPPFKALGVCIWCVSCSGQRFAPWNTKPSNLSEACPGPFRTYLQYVLIQCFVCSALQVGCIICQGAGPSYIASCDMVTNTICMYDCVRICTSCVRVSIYVYMYNVHMHILHLMPVYTSTWSCEREVVVYARGIGLGRRSSQPTICCRKSAREAGLGCAASLPKP